MTSVDFEFSNSRIPLAYLITFRCYGTWLHGDERGSVDSAHHGYGTPFLPVNANREQYRKEQLKHPSVKLDDEQRTVVEATIREVCQYRGWSLRAINVRTNHVHVVVSAGSKPEPVMQDFKAYATRRLAEAGLFPKGVKVWSRHGSTRYLWTAEQIDRACDYVINGQGDELPKSL